MASKRKTGKKFGLGQGRHRRKRQDTHLGRPLYKIHRKKQALRVKLKRFYKPKPKIIYQNKLKTTEYVSYLASDSLKLKIKSLRNMSPKGYRFINLDCLQGHVSDITLHTCTCPAAIRIACQGKSPIKLESELRSYGLACVIMAKCQGCSKTFSFDTSPKVPGSKRFDVNVRAVWGSMVTGNGPAHLNEIMATLDSPGLSQPSFSAIETDISNWWYTLLEKDMLEAGEEERRLAIERNDFHEEVPAITVITDGGWSKRSHKHSYNAAGGVAIIIGKETKKLLHIGVRNKYCYICSTKTNKPHTCFKNWDQDSQSMEADIILEGFLAAENKHGLRYMRVVGDGDSSVFAKIRDEVPVWGRYVTKEECANHVCKCFRSNLEKLVTNNPLYKGKHHLSKATRVRLVSALRCAIRVRSNEWKENKKDKSLATKHLAHDIKNSVHHVFGYHDNCSDFCRARPNSNAQITIPASEDLRTNQEDIRVIEDMFDFWSEGSSESAQEEARKGTHIEYHNVEKHIIKDVSLLLNRIAEKSDRLINNSTTNLAENWMRIRTKFDGGKVNNLCNRGSWHARCYGGALRVNLGPQWSTRALKASTGTEPGFYFRKLYARRETTLANSVRHKMKPNAQKLRWKKKISTLKTSTSRKAKQAYGPEAIDVSNDVSSSELETLKEQFVVKHIKLTSQQQQNLTMNTLKQSHSGLWHSERKKRLTASNFGSIVKRNPSLPVTKFIRNLLHSSFHGNRHTINGLLQEDTTIEEYKLKKAEEGENVVVKHTGLVVHPDFNYLAGSPDGIVSSTSNNTGLLEIKNLLHSKPLNLWQAASKSNFCLQIKDRKLQLKPNHIYFYQCHGLLNICNKPWIDFVVRTLNPHQIFIQRILRDNTLWEKDMLPKLQAFYFKVLLPELACPRDGKSPGIREPGVWFAPENTPKLATRKRKPRATKSTVKGRKRKATKPETSSESDTGHTDNPESVTVCSRRPRRNTVKFLGRCIRHEWIVDTSSNTKEWYTGTVVSIISGFDGELSTVYEVLYDGEDEPFEIDHLVEDYRSGSVQFNDV